jgi:hypothetical protein
MRTALLLLLASGASLVWSADNAGIGGPVSGYIVDGRFRVLRPIDGIPGAARLGAPLDLPFSIAVAAVAAPQDYALVTAANSDGRPVLVRGLRSGAPRTLPIENAIAATGIALADSAAVAALYSDSRLQFVTGLPDAPIASDPVDLAGLNGVASVAIEGAGRSVLLLSRDGSVFQASRGGDLKSIARVPGAVSAGFLPNGDDAVVASVETSEVILLHGLSGSLTIRTVSGPANGLGAPRSVRAINADEIAVVDGQGRLGAISVETGSIEWIGLAGAAEGIDALDRGLLVLNHAGRGPLLLLDITQGHAPYFVPPDERGEARHRK